MGMSGIQFSVGTPWGMSGIHFSVGTPLGMSEIQFSVGTPWGMSGRQFRSISPWGVRCSSSGRSPRGAFGAAVPEYHPVGRSVQQFP